MANKCNTLMGRDLSWAYGKWRAWFHFELLCGEFAIAVNCFLCPCVPVMWGIPWSREIT